MNGLSLRWLARVDGAGDQLFSRTGLAFDQHCRIDARDGANLLIDLLHGRALAEKIVKLRPLIEQAAQIVNFGHIVKKKDFTLWVARIVLHIGFEPKAPPAGSIQVQWDSIPLGHRLFDQRLQVASVFRIQTE